jgi:hypothetical protein
MLAHVDEDKFEAVYNSVPEGFGAMGAFPVHPIKPGAAATARRRLGQLDNDEAFVAAMPDDVYDGAASGCPMQHKQD